jgi:hypothetical protein
MTEAKGESKTFTLAVGKKARFGPLELKLTGIIPGSKPAPAPQMRRTAYLPVVRVTSGGQTKELCMYEGVSDEAFGYLFTFDKATEGAVTLTVGPNGSRLPPPEWETVGPINYKESATYRGLTITVANIKEEWFEVEGLRSADYAADVVVASGGKEASLHLTRRSDARAFGYDFHVLSIDEGFITLGLKEQARP